MIAPPPGCAFHPRCTFSRGRLPCRTDIPELRQIGDTALHLTRCHYAEELAEAQVVAGGAAVEEGRWATETTPPGRTQPAGGSRARRPTILR
jgi:hypothetical protein